MNFIISAKRFFFHRLRKLPVLIILVCACTEEKIDYSVDDSNNVLNETLSDAYFTDSEDISSVTVSSDDATSGGRIISVNDPRLACAIVSLIPDPATTHLIPKGVVTIDFGTGCTDNKGNVRKGIITISYHGRRFLPNSSVITTLSDYEVNGIKIEGTRTIANDATSTVTDPIHTTTMVGGKITWPDGTTTTRDEQTTREWKIAASSAATQWFVSGSATGVNRKGVPYSMMISEKLVYMKSCSTEKTNIPVQGTKQLIVDSKNIKIDYGSGACDRVVTVSVRSKSKEVTLKDGI